MSKIVFVFLVAFTSQSFALQSPPAAPPGQNDNESEGFIHRGCGYYDEIQDYISEKMPQNTAYRLPSAGDETTRWIVRAPDGTWLIFVEWQSRADRTESPACIVDSGFKSDEEAALTHPVTELPRGFISGRVSVPVSKPQRTSKSLL